MLNFNRKKPLLFAADVLLVVAVAGTLVGAVVRQQNNADVEANICRAPGKNFDLTLQNDAFSQSEMSVNLCDTITITNNDDLQYSLNFGDHDDHIAYPGFTAQIQAKDETIAIDALQKGDYEVHDHIRDKAVLKLTVGDKAS